MTTLSEQMATLHYETANNTVEPATLYIKNMLNTQVRFELKGNVARDLNLDGSNNPTLIFHDDLTTSVTFCLHRSEYVPEIIYTLSSNKTSMNASSDSVLITLDTTGVPDNTEVPYTITGILEADINNPLTGNFTVVGSTANITITTPIPTDDSISCAGASHGVFWSNTGEYYMRESIEGAVTFTMEFNGASISDQYMVEGTSYPANFMQQAIDWYNGNNGTSLDINLDGLVYSIRDVNSTNTVRIKFYTDGEPLFQTTEEDIGNTTYEELPGRIGFQACIIGVPM